jgi:hypothetical protein
MIRHADFHARRVVTGLNAEGRSTVIRDGESGARLVGAGNTKCDTWRVDRIPANVASGDGLEQGVLTHPPMNGLVHRVVAIPPDSDWDATQGYSDANGPLPGTVLPEDAGGIAGMHWTPTLDLVTVISGELVCLLEDGEVTLTPGDTIVQTGTIHAWRNRRDDTALIVSVMIAADRA